MEPLYYIWSIEHNRWWAPNANGYVNTRAEAGLFTLAQAEKYVAQANAYIAPPDEGVETPLEAIVPQ